MPYVSSTAQNNGVDGFVGNDEKVRVYQNCLTVANSGSVGTAFYQPFEFVASDHVTALGNSKLNEYSYQFLATLVSRLQENTALIGKLMTNEFVESKYFSRFPWTVIQTGNLCQIICGHRRLCRF